EEKIAKLKEQMKALQAIEVQLEESPDKQISLTDPDARSMMSSGGKGIVGYNVQTAVDTGAGQRWETHDVQVHP
ncbi:transposase IS4 family protein, partial [Pseudomonas syringae pv. actinidiae ICMP 19103]